MTEGRTFASPGMKVDGQIFAMSVRGELVFKLPADRCDQLVASHGARSFESGGRQMREWVVVPRAGTREAVELAEEALVFVRPDRG